MITMLIIAYSIFVFIGVRKNKKNVNEYKKKKCISVMVICIVSAIIMMHDWTYTTSEELVSFILLASSLTALLIYINDEQVN